MSEPSDESRAFHVPQKMNETAVKDRPPEVQSYVYNDKKGKKSRPRKKKNAFFVLFVILLCFAILFLAVDFFTNGFLIERVTAGLKGGLYTYYAVVIDKESRDTAYAQSLLVKQSGGSGYILTQEGFKVVYAVFANRNEADTVISKNTNTYVFVMETRSKEKSLFSVLDGAVRQLIEATVKLESGEMNESGVATVIRTQKSALESLIESYDEKNHAQENSLLLYCIGSLDALDATAPVTRVVFLSDVRYAVSGIVATMCSAGI